MSNDKAPNGQDTSKDPAASAAPAAEKPAETVKAGAEKSADASPSKSSSAPVNGLDKDKSFELLEKALGATDWSWKTKQGDDREIARLTFMKAQAAWVEAALHDPKRATQMWSKSATNKPPSAEMEKMLADRKRTDAPQRAAGGSEVDSLTNDLNDLSKRRDLNEQKNRKTTLRASLGDWNIMRADAQRRSEDSKRARQAELMTPEPNKTDTGLHLLTSFYKGFRTHHERTQSKLDAHRAKLVGKGIKEIQSEIGRASTRIKNFESELNIPLSDRETYGLVGRSRKAVASSRVLRVGGKSVTILGKSAAKVATKVAEKTSEVAKAVAIQGAALTSNPGSIGGNQAAADYKARMAQFHKFQQHSGMGTP